MKMKSSLFALALLAQPLAADMLDNVCAGTFGIWGQATYLKPTQGERDYALQSFFPFALENSVGNGPIKTRSVCPDYKWGFEVGGIYLTSCSDYYLSLFGGWNQFTGNNRLNGGISQPLIEESFTVTAATRGDGYASLKTDYWYLDGRIGHVFQQCCIYQLQAFLGVRYIDVKERLIAAFTGINAAVFPVGQATRQRETLDFSGTGPEIGFGGSFRVWQGLSLRGDCAVMALIGTRKYLVRSIQIRPIFGVTPPSSNSFPSARCTGIVPGIDMKAGANWSMSYCRVKGGVEVGYKVHQYFHVFDQAARGRFQGTSRRNAGFAGPYLSLGVTY